jgi:small GTP-binding protein
MREPGYAIVIAEPITKKICLIGDFGVGKTSVVARFVDHTFSDKYLSTFGVTIKTKFIEQEPAIKLVIWDIAGNDIVTATNSKYLRGADGFLLVVDGTRPVTALTAMRLREEVRRECGDIPAVCLMNKSDLTNEWRLTDAHEIALRAGSTSAYRTSAKTGANVDQSFLDLARAVCD